MTVQSRNIVRLEIGSTELNFLMLIVSIVVFVIIAVTAKLHVLIADKAQSNSVYLHFALQSRRKRSIA
ncbi:hypothetical protein RRG08_048930 [Elysia crispata]|uniref:Uncharacterized protein n=1 Tax=Elysia crispata TaxID=231223 RepID=A0AAE1D1R1_9GAST|nr:hypothetical protein RRG08_048930 [Elysia crispata]